MKPNAPHSHRADIEKGTTHMTDTPAALQSRQQIADALEYQLGDDDLPGVWRLNAQDVRTIIEALRSESAPTGQDEIIERIAALAEQQAEHAVENAEAMKQYDVAEARARELAGVHFREFAWLIRTYKSEALPTRTLPSARCVVVPIDDARLAESLLWCFTDPQNPEIAIKAHKLSDRLHDYINAAAPVSPTPKRNDELVKMMNVIADGLDKPECGSRGLWAAWCRKAAAYLSDERPSLQEKP